MASLQEGLSHDLEAEQSRPYTQYRYFHVADQPVPQQVGLNLSPLAAFPVKSQVPGIVGYFQIDPDGSFHTPLLPSGDSPPGVEVPQLEERIALRDRLSSMLSQEPPKSDQPIRSEDLEALNPADEGGSDLAADLLNKNLASNVDPRMEKEFFGQLDESDATRSSGPAEQSPGAGRQERRLQQSSRTQAFVFESQNRLASGPPGNRNDTPDVTFEHESLQRTAREGIFSDLNDSSLEKAESSGRRLEEGSGPLAVEAEVDPFAARLVDHRWLAFSRKVWWHDHRYVQGFVSDSSRFWGDHLSAAFQNSALPANASYLLFHRGEPLNRPQAESSGRGKPLLLLSSDLPHPFQDFHLAVTLPFLPQGPGHRVVDAMAVILALLIAAGVVGMYRLTSSQLELSRKKSDFISAVSHELKTPLASIRMYGEMLVEGWVDDESKKRSYYRHIHDESERLSRLIHNVLCLAELERDRWPIRLEDHDLGRFVQGLAQRLDKQAQRAGFELETSIDDIQGRVRIDADAMTQILINLIDNAIKFSKRAQTKKVVLSVKREGGACILSVRDFGPGIPKAKLNKIFDRFYRLDNEMTRQASGTGIGLSMVKMLAQAMKARVQAANRRPGAEFTLHLPLISSMAQPGQPSSRS